MEARWEVFCSRARRSLACVLLQIFLGFAWHTQKSWNAYKSLLCVSCFIQGDEYYDGDELFMHEERPFWCYKSM